ncbi:MAG: hypothetical protein ABSG69_13565 [Candidatus Acidiferrum sp.]|jgi:hypothetical protein
MEKHAGGGHVAPRQFVLDALGVKRAQAVAARLSPAAGTYGNVFDGFKVTDSLPIPRRTGVFATSENITSGALSTVPSWNA